MRLKIMVSFKEFYKALVSKLPDILKDPVTNGGMALKFIENIFLFAMDRVWIGLRDLFQAYQHGTQHFG